IPSEAAMLRASIIAKIFLVWTGCCSASDHIFQLLPSDPLRLPRGGGEVAVVESRPRWVAQQIDVQAPAPALSYRSVRVGEISPNTVTPGKPIPGDVTPGERVETIGDVRYTGTELHLSR